ncbi:hypothetical protein GCM10008967_30350 [Bacillus carboniphilus]|uniref:Permease n=1 Tax=Bacillus carboniphilus TaxID=86663 RepID=A0ABN0WHK5_9BACI
MNTKIKQEKIQKYLYFLLGIVGVVFGSMAAAISPFSIRTLAFITLAVGGLIQVIGTLMKHDWKKVKKTFNGFLSTAGWIVMFAIVWDHLFHGLATVPLLLLIVVYACVVIGILVGVGFVWSLFKGGRKVGM